MAVIPFRISIATGILEQLNAAIALAGRQGRRTEAIAAARAIHDGLRWIADDFGESRYPSKCSGNFASLSSVRSGLFFRFTRNDAK